MNALLSAPFAPASLTRAVTKSVSRSIAAPGHMLPTVANNPSVASWERAVPTPPPAPPSVTRGLQCPPPTHLIIQKPLRFPPLCPQTPAHVPALLPSTTPSLQNPSPRPVSQSPSFPRPLKPSVLLRPSSEVRGARTRAIRGSSKKRTPPPLLAPSILDFALQSISDYWREKSRHTYLCR